MRKSVHSVLLRGRGRAVADNANAVQLSSRSAASQIPVPEATSVPSPESLGGQHWRAAVGQGGRHSAPGLAAAAAPFSTRPDAPPWRTAPPCSFARRGLHTPAAPASSAAPAAVDAGAEGPRRILLRRPTAEAQARLRAPGLSQDTPRAINGRLVEAADISQVLAVVGERASAFNAINISTAWHRLAVLSRRGQWGAGRTRADAMKSAEVKLLADLTAERAENIPPRELCTVVWAWAALRFEPPREVRNVALRRALEGPDPVAGGSAVVPGGGGGGSRGFGGQSVANVLWAAATMGWRLSDPTLARVGKLAEAFAAEFTPQGISNAVWALSTLGCTTDALLDRAAERVAAEAAAFKPLELSNTAWAWATQLHDPGEAALRALERELERRPSEFSPQAISIVLWSMAVLGYSPGQRCTESVAAWVALTEPLGGESISRRRSDATRGASTSETGSGADRLTERDRGAGRGPGGAGQLKSQDCANLLWALAALGDTSSALFRAVWAQAVSISPKDFNPDGLKSLFQVETVLQLEGRPPGLPPLPARMRAICERHWVSTVSGHSMSETHAIVSGVLADMGVPHKNEERTPDGYTSLDILLTGRPGEKVVVEVDGPMHFLRNTGAPTGRMRLRNRILAARGYEVVSLPVTQWPHSDAEEQRAYLERKLAHVLPRRCT